MNIGFFTTLLLALTGAIGGTLMALGFMHPSYFECPRSPSTQPVARAFVITGAVFAILFGVARLFFYFKIPGLLPNG